MGFYISEKSLKALNTPQPCQCPVVLRLKLVPRSCKEYAFGSLASELLSKYLFLSCGIFRIFCSELLPRRAKLVKLKFL